MPPYAVGFDITLSYGTAVIRYANGSYTPVAKIDSSPAYQETMKYLSLESSQHLHPPYRFAFDSLWDKPREMMRSFRKNLGLPASSDVGKLGNMIRQLRKATEEKLGEKIKTAVVTRPELPALYHEDMVDALEYAGLEYLEACWDCPIQFELWSGYAGNGFGLCRDFNDTDACKKEIGTMPVEVVISLLFTETTLEVHQGYLSSAYLFSEYPDMRVDLYSNSWDIGHGSMPSGEGEKQQYWDMVYSRIYVVTKKFVSLPIKMVIFQGESASNRHFLEVVKNLLAELQPEAPEYLYEDPIFVAARGAAEYGFRRLSGLLI